MHNLKIYITHISCGHTRTNLVWVRLFFCFIEFHKMFDCIEIVSNIRACSDVYLVECEFVCLTRKRVHRVYLSLHVRILDINGSLNDCSFAFFHKQDCLCKKALLLFYGGIGGLITWHKCLSYKNKKITVILVSGFTWPNTCFSHQRLIRNITSDSNS